MDIPKTLQEFLALEEYVIPGPLPVVCPMCDLPKDTIAIRTRNTAYVEQCENYMTCCDECAIEDDAYWQEQWDEYYAGRL